jgi:tRNA modification GTPase
MPQLPLPDDSIAALASAAGASARGIIRVSGPETIDVLRDWFSPATGVIAPFENRSAACTRGHLPVSGLTRPVPVDLCLWPSRRSYTGQPMAELHAPGSPPILEGILSELFARGVRPAQPGEFTLRAFLAGRLDLMQAEAVLGVIDARDRRELQQALDQLGGGLSSQIVRLRGDLLDLLADLEAGLDFAEEDIEFVSHGALLGRIGLARDAVAGLLRCAGRRLRSATQARVVLAGPPNAGKSTLFNALSGADAALVSNERGTTRDYLAVDVATDGVTFTLIDTAGSQRAEDVIAAAAQGHQREQLSQSDLVVCCHPADDPQAEFDALPAGKVLFVRTKADLDAKRSAGDLDGQSATLAGPVPPSRDHCESPPCFLSVSARTGAGVR